MSKQPRTQCSSLIGLNGKEGCTLCGWDCRHTKLSTLRTLFDLSLADIAITFELKPRDVRQLRVFRDGEPWISTGLGRVQKTMQREMEPALGRRHWR